MAMSIKAARINAGYNQTEAAELLGVSRTTVSYWETGTFRPNKKNLEKVVEVYKLESTQDIFLP